MTALDFAIIALCAYRITRFFVFDSLIGFNPQSGSKMSQRIDRFAWNSDGTERGRVRDKIGNLLVCPFCLGFWISLAVVSAWWFGSDPVRWGITAWAVAGAQCLLNVKEQDGHSYILRRIREQRAKRKVRRDNRPTPRRPTPTPPGVNPGAPR